MFSCSHVRYCFQVFSFFESLSFSANFLSCKQLSFMCRGHGGPSLAMPTKLWEVTGWETGRSFLYLQNVTGCAMDAES